MLRTLWKWLAATFSIVVILLAIGIGLFRLLLPMIPQYHERIETFADYQVNGDLMAAAPGHARVLHCLPAVRGEEITDEVIDGPQSDVIAQAGNRMHAQKGLLVWLLNRPWIDANVSVT